MTLAPGIRLGPYEVLAPLGAGGMGEVYRAKDLRVDRAVALKVLPEEFFEGEERRQRFEREARMLASLNHPGIAVLYSFEESGGRHLLVMELVEGDGLDQKISSGSLSLEESVSLARQIAEALEAAHEKGVVHRDLKPANVKVTPEGRVKLLDFGLAKIFEGDAGAGSSAGVTHSPTLTARGTAAGVILGTAAYMSPEQARGKPVDKRTDVWAFGCVLFEMLTGKRAFEGETVTDVLAAILTKDPDWAALPGQTPAGVRKVLRRCLQRDARLRLRDIGDARLDLEEAQAGPQGTSASIGTGTFIFEENPASPGPTVGRSAPASRERGSKKSLSVLLPWAVAAAFAAAAGALALRARAPQAPAPPSLTASLLPPEGWTFDLLGGPPVLSPDGSRLAFVVTDGKKNQLCVRSLATGEALLLSGSEGVRNPFWSHDGRMIGFMGQLTGLAAIPSSGGAVEFIAASGPGRGGNWGPDGTILYSPALLNAIFRVTPGQKGRVAVTTVDEARGESSHQWPEFLPDGKHFLFIVQRVDRETRRNESELYLQALGSKDRKLLVKAASRAMVVPGHLLYTWNGSLMAQPFDAGRLETIGDPFVVVPRVQYLVDGGTGIFTASAGGLLVYAAGGTIGNSRLTVYDRSGKALRTVGEVGNYWTPRVSPDGRIVVSEAIDSVSSNRDIWTFDAVGAEQPVRRTFDPGEDYTPVFSPDGKRFAFGSFRKGAWFIFEKTLAGGDEERLIARAAPSGPAPAPSPADAFLGPGSKFLTDWTPDGRSIVFNGSTAEMADDIWLLSAAEGRAREFLRTPASERDAAFSRDGLWVAYMSNETGRQEVYVRPASGAGGKWQISAGGGSQPRWSRDGRELFYLAEGFRLTAVSVKTGSAFEKGTPHELFTLQSRRTNIPQYDPFPDGQRFVVNTVVTEKASTPLTLVQNWTARVKPK
ncbi:MAG: serine/threonine-protein kinase [Thermoanaerobaculia bacterium]|nr:serine/threonine-protein kinase [Thermoanaerobaculia bacterium]